VENGFGYFLVDGHAVEGGKPLQIYSDADASDEVEPEYFAATGLSTYRPYRIQNRPISVLGRNALVSAQVWSKDYGYPGHRDYRDFHKQSHRSGLKYWRITNRNGDDKGKLLYDPEAAGRTCQQHARHFVNLIGDIGQQAVSMGFRDPLIVACYDTELFGHWWWEGVDWLERVARALQGQNHTAMVLPGSVIREKEQLAEAQVFESSWGIGGKHMGWSNAETDWMWSAIDRAREAYHSVADCAAGDLAAAARRQAGRELMLMESSDWFFMVTHRNTRDYAINRFLEHYGKLLRLVSMIKRNDFTPENFRFMQAVQEDDDIFA
jgi:1,4-alpha-glucan branching enzyme